MGNPQSDVIFACFTNAISPDVRERAVRAVIDPEHVPVSGMYYGGISRDGCLMVNAAAAARGISAASFWASVEPNDPDPSIRAALGITQDCLAFVIGAWETSDAVRGHSLERLRRYANEHYPPEVQINPALTMREVPPAAPRAKSIMHRVGSAIASFVS